MSRITSRRRRPVVAALAMVAALATGAALALPAIPASAADSGRHVIVTIPGWAVASADVGPVASSMKINGEVFLASRDAAGLAAFADTVSDPDSAQYHQYLSPDETWAKFGALPDAAANVSAWLTSSGLTVTETAKRSVAFSGTAAAVGTAFATSIHNFSVDGKSVYSATGSVSVPDSLSADVLAVLGLSSALVENHPLLASTIDPAPTAKTASDWGMAKPIKCNDYEGQKMAKPYPKAYGEVQPYAVCGYEPAQFRGAYGVTEAGYTGKGITMTVVDAYSQPTMRKDLKKWAKNRGESKIKKKQYKEYVPDGTGYNEGWGGEQALDIEAILAVAPKAKVAYVAATSPSDSGFFTAFGTILDKHIGDAVNNSWGGGSDAQTPPGSIAAYENLFQQGAAEGIGFYFSTGDSGGLSGGQPVTMYPGVDPYVTGVGGSAIGIDKNNGYMWETSWETDYSTLAADGKSWTPAPPGNFSSGAGGGTSVKFAQPKWQKGVVPTKFSEVRGGAPMRTIPDIGADADPTTGFLEGYSTQVDGKFVYGELRIGGTSLSSPLIVGLQALAEQAAGGKAIGFANPAIYKLYATNALNDVTDTPLGAGVQIAHVRTISVSGVTTVALGTAGQSRDGGLWSIKGYDTTTGIGTPTTNYYDALAGILK